MLDTPEIVGELREEMLVNCSTPEDSPDAIFWTIGSTESEHEDEKNFKFLILSLSDWNMTAKCTVKLNQTFECSKDLKITVYSKCDSKSIHYQKKGNDDRIFCIIPFSAPPVLHFQTFHP